MIKLAKVLGLVMCALIVSGSDSPVVVVPGAVLAVIIFFIPNRFFSDIYLKEGEVK